MLTYDQPVLANTRIVLERLALRRPPLALAGYWSIGFSRPIHFEERGQDG